MRTTIVVADDHRIVREGIRKLLETRDDLEVVGEACNGEEAVKLVLERKPDIALMDIRMPGLSGIDATRRIRQHRLGTTVLAVSMYGRREFVEEALQAGASGYVVKSSAADDLLEAIDAIRSGASHVPPAISQPVVEARAIPGVDEPRGIEVLTAREREVLRLIAEGHSTKAIAAMLGVAFKTVETHRSNLMAKLDIHKVSSLVRFAIRAGLVAP